MKLKIIFHLLVFLSLKEGFCQNVNDKKIYYSQNLSDLGEGRPLVIGCSLDMMLYCPIFCQDFNPRFVCTGCETTWNAEKYLLTFSALAQQYTLKIYQGNVLLDSLLGIAEYFIPSILIEAYNQELKETIPLSTNSLIIREAGRLRYITRKYTFFNSYKVVKVGISLIDESGNVKLKQEYNRELNDIREYSRMAKPGWKLCIKILDVASMDYKSRVRYKIQLRDNYFELSYVK